MPKLIQRFGRLGRHKKLPSRAACVDQRILSFRQLLAAIEAPLAGSNQNRLGAIRFLLADYVGDRMRLVAIEIKLGSRIIQYRISLNTILLVPVEFHKYHPGLVNREHSLSIRDICLGHS